MEIIEKRRKVTLKAYYASLPLDKKTELEITVAKKCMKALGTVRQWVYGCRKPSALCQKIIADHLKMPIGDLFPKEEEVQN